MGAIPKQITNVINEQSDSGQLFKDRLINFLMESNLRHVVQCRTIELLYYTCTKTLPPCYDSLFKPKFLFSWQNVNNLLTIPLIALM